MTEPTVGNLYDHILENGPTVVRAAGQLWRVEIPHPGYPVAGCLCEPCTRASRGTTEEDRESPDG